jgi:hypothetical protein
MTARRFGEVVIVGGGCYGTFYVRQMLEARSRGKAEFTRLLVVDRDPGCRYTREVPPGEDHRLVTEDWDAFFDAWLSPALRDAPSPNHPIAESPHRPNAESPHRPIARSPDTIVPSPLMPHLMFHWLVRRARARWPGRQVEVRPLATGPGTPYDTAAPDGTRYISFADWLCPTHCIEPLLCPVTRAPRTWEMREAMAQWAGRLGAAGPVVFQCEHQVFGVGMFSRDEVLAGEAELARHGNRPGAVELLVGTISSCHGAANLLHLGAG